MNAAFELYTKYRCNNYIVYRENNMARRKWTSTHNFKHWDFVQLHGFLGLMPLASELLNDLDTFVSVNEPPDEFPTEPCEPCELFNKVGVDCWDLLFDSASACCHNGILW